MNAGFESFLASLVRSSVGAGVLVLLVLATQRLFRRQLSPHWHGALWLLVLVRLLPFSFSSEASLFNLLPRWNTAPVVSASTPAPAPAVAAPWLINLGPANPTSTQDTSALSSPAVSDNAREIGFSWSWSAVLFLGWATGVVVLAGCVAVTTFSWARSIAALKPLDCPAAHHVLEDCCARMGIVRPPQLVESAAVSTPALHGVWRPRLLLPVGFSALYSADEQRFVFLHELAHLRRGDLLLNWSMTALQIVHWFNPLVWFGFARWRVDREIACDAAALEAAGPGRNRDYGQTMLRLLQQLSRPSRRPGLVGILEDRRQLRRRMEMIAAFSPARRAFGPVGLFAILALVGLTDAQVAPTAPPAEPATSVAMQHSPEFAVIPQPATPYVLFLVNASETMLGELNPAGSPGDTRERGRTYLAQLRAETDAQKRAAPKWIHATQTLEKMLTALPPDASFRVALYAGDEVQVIGARAAQDDGQAMVQTLTRIRAAVPHGAANLESAFAFISDAASGPQPQRIVLITDGLPTATIGGPASEEVTEAARIRAFEIATKRLPPRIPVQTVLLPSGNGDPGAAGLYWELANATRGGLTTAAATGSAPRTHLAFVIDTSGSMRDPNGGGLWPVVITTIEAAIDANPQLVGIEVLDGDGRFILGRRGNGLSGWLPNTPDVHATIKRVLRRYNQDTVSNPVPGIYNAMRFLHDKDAPEMRMGIYIFGDEFNSSDPAGLLLERVETLNPRDANGRRLVTISAFGFPTTIRYQFSMGNTGLRFANLMRLLTQEHDGSFIALPDL